LQFCEIFGYKKEIATNFFHPFFVAVFGSGIRNGYKSGSRIRDKRPGSATLVLIRIAFSVDPDLGGFVSFR
jgi:hypothetical protein